MIEAKIRAIRFSDDEWSFLQAQPDGATSAILRALRAHYPDFPRIPRSKGGAPVGNTNAAKKQEQEK